MGKVPSGSTSNTIGINNTPAPTTSELADAQSVVMGLAPRLELGGQAKDNVLRHLHESRCHHRRRLAIGKGDAGTAAGSCTRPGSTQATTAARHWSAAMARQLPRGQVKQDCSVVNTREPTRKQGTAAH
eukprot:COSAG05_NODE_636_length_8175_cov_51.220530_4_plen_129_part_00